jgi:hypothetical protein
MMFRSPGFRVSVLMCSTLAIGALHAQAPAQSASSSSSPKQAKKPAAPSASEIEAGAVNNGVYRNKALALVCKIPAGWVMRTDEMNAQEEEKDTTSPPATGPASSNSSGKVLLATFSRPPEAKAEEVNASILIAAEKVAAYPGLTDAAQYFGPLTEVAKAQGFTVDEEPYEFAVGTKKLVRGDFHKDVGTRRMLQSSLVMLAHGYAVSITVIGGTEDEVEGLVDGVSFGPEKAAAK